MRGAGKERRQVYDLMNWGPTSSNCSPARFVFLCSREAKERLLRALSPGNVAKTMAAPVTVIVAYDLLFYEKLPRLFFGAGKECDGCDQEFFAAGHVKSNFLCNLGHGDRSKGYPRGPRLDFAEACTLL